MDVHIPGGINDLSRYPSKVYNFEGCYSIPYRCYYSRNIDNLMMAGRDISTSKMAFSSTRVMGTCAVGGQASGTAAALAVRHHETPRDVGLKHIHELQQVLLKNDCYIPGFVNEDENDLARNAIFTANSEIEGCSAENVANGVSRPVGNKGNYWQSKDLSNAMLTCTLKEPTEISEIRITFDTNLSTEIQPSMIRNVYDREVKGMPNELVKSYIVRMYLGKNILLEKHIEDNHQRLNVIETSDILCDRIEIAVVETYGVPFARIQEVRMYGKNT